MATRNIQMNYYNGTDYDVLYPQSTIAQIENLQSLLDAIYTFNVIATKTYSLDGIQFTGSVIEDSGVTVNIADFMNYENLSQSLFLMVETNITFFNPNTTGSGWFNLTLAPGNDNNYFSLGQFIGTHGNSVSYSSKHIHPIFEVINHYSLSTSSFYTFNDLNVNNQSEVKEIVKNLNNYSYLGIKVTI